MQGAVVLAGGYGTRFGDGDKAVADVAGVPMIRRVISRVAPAVDDIVVNARRDQRESIDDALDDRFSYRFAFDEEHDRGPLAGMATGLDAVDAAYSLVVACDMPFVDRRFVETLFDRATEHEAAIPLERGADDVWLQPLQAVYETERMAEVAATALEDDVESPVTAVETLDYETVPVSVGSSAMAGLTLRNVNTPAELREAERHFSRRTSADR
ncbi:MAG: molybdenum cofactor guanylyltransferase [Halanaeroarchaeum sp.]